MSIKNALVVVLCLGLAVSVAFAMAGKCNMQTVEKAKYCEKCKAIDPKIDADGNCDGAKPVEVNVCVKTYNVCNDCKKKLDGDKVCCPNGKAEKVTDKALIVYKCEGCGAVGKAEGKCEAEACKAAGKLIKAECSKSGTSPHEGEAGK